MNKLTPPVPQNRGVSKHGTDWDYLDKVTDDDIARAIELDPDAAPILSEEEMRQRYKPHRPRISR